MYVTTLRHGGARKAVTGMEVRFNLRGAERKRLANAVSELAGAPLAYRGAPSFAYETGSYGIDKDGTLTGPDDRGMLADLEGLYSLISAAKSFDAEPTAKTTGTATDSQSEDKVAAPAPDEQGMLTIELPLEGFTSESLANLEKLVTSKAGLIRKATGADALPILRDEGRLRFPWFTTEAKPEETKAYMQLVSALCAMAKSQKRVNAKENPSDNEKFAFRVFLIRLGFIGDEYKAARKILLKNLSGNSAFRNAAPQAEANSDE